MKMSERRRRPRVVGGRVDVERVAEAVSRPGIDPRTWVTLGRTSADLSASDYDLDLGWTVDVELQGGGTHGNVVSCRMASGWPGVAGYGEFRPPGQDEEVVVVLPGGDPEEDPIVLGVVTSRSGADAPTTVAGRDIDPTAETQPGGPVGPGDCEFVKSPYSRVEEHEGERHIRARWVTIEATEGAGAIKLGTDPTHPPARADELITVLSSLIDAISQLASAGVTHPMGPGVLTGLAGWQSIAEQLKKQIQSKLASEGVVVD